MAQLSALEPGRVVIRSNDRNRASVAGSGLPAERKSSVTEGLRGVAGGARLICAPLVAGRLHRHLDEADALRGDFMGNGHHEPGGRAGDRRRQFEDSRGLTGRRELPLDDEPEADESEADEARADRSEADGAEPPAEDQADDQG